MTVDPQQRHMGSMVAAVSYAMYGVVFLVIAAIMMAVAPAWSMVWWIGLGVWGAALLNWAIASVVWFRAYRRLKAVRR